MNSGSAPGTVFLTAKEVMERLRCSVDHVYDLLDRGDLKEFKDGRRRKVYAASVEEYIKRRSVQGEEEPALAPSPPRSVPARVGSGPIRLAIRPPAKLKEA